MRNRLIAIFMALALTVVYFYTIQPYALGYKGNSHNPFVFTATAHDGYHLDQLWPCWRTRISGLLICGKMTDLAAASGQISAEKFTTLFCLYHSVWVLLLFLLLIAFLGDRAIAIMPLCYAGLAYIDSPTPYHYHFPWDIPAIFFFTLTYLLWTRRWYGWMIWSIIIGTTFKETSIIPALLFFFTDLPWRRRFIHLGIAAAGVLAFKVTIGYVVFNKFYVLTQHVFYLKDEYSHHSHLPTLLLSLMATFHQGWNNFWFIGAGTTLIALFVPTRTREQLATKVLIITFLAAAMMELNTTTEWRAFGELIPLCAIFLFDGLNLIQPVTVPSPAASEIVPESVQKIRRPGKHRTKPQGRPGLQPAFSGR